MSALLSIAESLLTIAEHLEWSERCSGATRFRHEQPFVFRCCPECHGVEPSQMDGLIREAIPADRFGHRPNCQIAAHLSLLRGLLK